MQTASIRNVRRRGLESYLVAELVGHKLMKLGLIVQLLLEWSHHAHAVLVGTTINYACEISENV